MTTSADSGESRRTAMRTQTGLPPTTEQHQEQLPCPRCDSANTKFCYYNNYNFSQPRHFCKSCRRYWTHGGTLRDVPVGGGTRRAAKRSRTCLSSSSVAGTLDAPLQATPVLFPQTSSTLSNGAVTVNDGKGGSLSLSGSFTSLLSQNGDVVTAATTHGTSGFDDVSFGLGKGAAWPFSSTAGDADATNVASNAVSVVPATWQFEGLESSNVGGFVPGEYFAWPDLYVTAPVSSLK